MQSTYKVHALDFESYASANSATAAGLVTVDYSIIGLPGLQVLFRYFLIRTDLKFLLHGHSAAPSFDALDKKPVFFSIYQLDPVIYIH